MTNQDLTTPYPWLDDIIEVNVLKLEQKWIDFEHSLTVEFEAQLQLNHICCKYKGMLDDSFYDFLIFGKSEIHITND